MSKKRKPTTPIAGEPYVPYGEEPLSFEYIWQLFLETDRKFQETEQRFKETDKQFKETDKKIKELSYLFTSQWGRLVESLVEGAVVRLFNEVGILVQRTTERMSGSYQGENYEFDIIAHDGNEVVVIEVKTTLKPKDIKDFIAKMNRFKTYAPEYKSHRVMGCVAYLKSDPGARTMAEKSGLFVIRATGDSASLVNAKDFKPGLF